MMTGHVLHSLNEHRRQVPFSVLFKAVFGFALAGILVVGAAFIFVNDNVADRIMLPLQILAALAGAVVGAFAAWRASINAHPN